MIDGFVYGVLNTPQLSAGHHDPSYWGQSHCQRTFSTSAVVSPLALLVPWTMKAALWFALGPWLLPHRPCAFPIH